MIPPHVDTGLKRVLRQHFTDVRLIVNTVAYVIKNGWLLSPKTAEHILPVLAQTLPKSISWSLCADSGLVRLRLWSDLLGKVAASSSDWQMANGYEANGHTFLSRNPQWALFYGHLRLQTSNQATFEFGHISKARFIVTTLGLCQSWKLSSFDLFVTVFFVFCELL